MANILTESPWVLDGSSLNTILVATNIKIHHFEFVEYTSGLTSIVKLANRFGALSWYATGDTDGEVIKSGQVGWTYGLQELVHTDGFVLVYFE